MELLCTPRSPYARKVLIVAIENGTIAAIRKVASAAALSAPPSDLMKKNPLGKLPVLVSDDGLVLFDSTVICEYLDQIGSGPKFFPADARPRFEALRWHALGQGMTEHLQLWKRERDREPALRSEALLDKHRQRYIGMLDGLETMIDGLPSDAFHIGHVALTMALGYTDFRFAELDWRRGRPRLAAWEQTMAKRPSLQQTLAELRADQAKT